MICLPSLVALHSLQLRAFNATVEPIVSSNVMLPFSFVPPHPSQQHGIG